MIDLTEKGLPDTVIIGGEPFQINTDYRVWMRFCQEFENWDRSQDLKIPYIFFGEIRDIQTVEEMKSVLSFAYPPAVLPRDTGGISHARVLDYYLDADYIYSAFLGQYGIDLTETEMHWHKFRALLSGLNSSTRLLEIMGYRCYEGNDKDLIKLRNAWELPEKCTEADNQAKREFDDYFG